MFAVQAGDTGTNTPATAAITNAGPESIAVDSSAYIVVTVDFPLTAGNQYQEDSGIVYVTVNAVQQ